MQKQSVIALIVTYGNRSHFVTQVLLALSASDRQPDRIIIVLNGNDVPCPSAHDGNNIPIEMVRVSENSGSAGGFFAGLKYLAGSTESIGWVWLLDDDNTPEQDCLNLLLEDAKSSPNFISTAIRPDRPEHSIVGGIGLRSYFSKWSFMGFDLFSRKHDIIIQSFGRLKIVNVPFCGYGGMLIPSSILDLNALPDPSLFLYHDDTEWCVRLRGYGYQTRIVLNARVRDIDLPWGGAVAAGSPLFAKATDPAKLWYNIRNRIIAERLLGHEGFLYFVHICIWTVYMLSRVLFHQSRSLPLITATRVCISAVINGLAGSHSRYTPNK